MDTRWMSQASAQHNQISYTEQTNTYQSMFHLNACKYAQCSMKARYYNTLGLLKSHLYFSSWQITDHRSIPTTFQKNTPTRNPPIADVNFAIGNLVCAGNGYSVPSGAKRVRVRSTSAWKPVAKIAAIRTPTIDMYNSSESSCRI